MTALLLVAQLTIITSAPRLSPVQAVQVLQAARSELNRTGVEAWSDGPRVITIRSTPGAGPFGHLRSTPLPVSCCNTYIHPRTPELIVRRERTR